MFRFRHFIFAFLLGLLLFSPATARPLRIALLPIPDALPFHVAVQNGYFEEANLVVEALPVSSALQRDQLLQAGRIDGMLNELSSVASFHQSGQPIRVVTTARRPMGKSPLFRFLARPGSPHRTLSDLGNVPVAVSKNTVIEYVTDRTLQNAGLSGAEIRMQSVPVIPERFQLLVHGRLEAAVIPDPLAAAAIRAGAVEVGSDLAAPFFSLSVISLSADWIATHEKKTGAFVRAWERGARELNRHPERYRDLFEKKVRMPPSIVKAFPLPPFPVGERPTQAQWRDVMDWMTTRNLLEAPIAFEDGIWEPGR